ncbi:TrbI F-type domain-containing protein [Klebsiella pneumoniae]|uniref:TrbI F-type domain-containing protein n=1 Tax=Klebsiella pneumoniae TaxID=573 RepID=UPI0022E1DDEA|nr:TrbI F-type domain-containing protein [Klebsiella pneumoniae]
MKNNTEQPVSTTSHTFRRIPVIVALVLFALATSAFLSRVVLEYSTPRVVAFDIHHVVILVSPAVVQGAPDVTRNIQHDIARRMKGEQ